MDGLFTVCSSSSTRGINSNYNEETDSRQTEGGGISHTVSLHNVIPCHKMLVKIKAYTSSRQDRTCLWKIYPWTIAKYTERTSGSGTAWQHMAASWWKHWEYCPFFRTLLWVSFKQVGYQGDGLSVQTCWATFMFK